MKINFHKYQGTGNDFVILDNRQGNYSGLAMDRIKLLCDRRFGIGADGLLLLNQKDGYDFEMVYYNADGRESSMCGNGGRCLVKFAFHTSTPKNRYLFLASDGEHEAKMEDNGVVKLKMQDVKEIVDYHGDFILNTGSPHYVKMVSNLMQYDVFHKGMDIRYDTDFAKEGINVNFVEHKKADEIMVRTYERGVEDETFSCGTGVTACALVNHHNELGYNDVSVITKGGRLVVEYDRVGENQFENIWLCGPAEKVFDGDFELAT
jgi:diaminopimelate epimerase